LDSKKPRYGIPSRGFSLPVILREPPHTTHPASQSLAATEGTSRKFRMKKSGLLLVVL